MQILRAVEFQFKPALALAVDDFNPPAQLLTQVLLALGNVVHFEGRQLLFRLWLPGHVPAQQLRLPHGQTQSADLLGGIPLLLLGFQGQDRSCVARGQSARRQFFLYFLGKCQEPYGVCHRRTGFAHPVRRFLLGKVVLADKPLVALGFFQRIQILTLEVFNQGQLRGFPVVGLDDHRRDLGKPRLPGCPPAALARDYLIVAAGHFPDSERLDHAVEPDGLRQSFQFFLVEDLPGLVGIGFDFIKRQVLIGGAFPGFLGHISQQRSQASAKTLL